LRGPTASLVATGEARGMMRTAAILCVVGLWGVASYPSSERHLPEAVASPCTTIEAPTSAVAPFVAPS
jgi:hypothetical protein